MYIGELNIFLDNSTQVFSLVRIDVLFLIDDRVRRDPQKKIIVNWIQIWIAPNKL